MNARTGPADQHAADPPPAGRARPLPPDERRATLIAATLPLLAEYGTKVTTRQIAEAAGVAEGTIFRVFPDKDALVNAACTAIMDPLPVLAELNGVDTDLPLRPRLIEVTGILQRHLIRVFGLMSAAGMRSAAAMQVRREAIRPANDQIYQAVQRILEPDRDQLRFPVAEVVRLLRLLTFAGSHFMINEGKNLSAEQVVSVILDGVLDRDHGGPTAC